ncbi:leucokinin [Eupeodes corollae]|uniref:leucokinin n=1 Tax=Eupeodes corollae TaxID=290404 RepID=UPI002490B750|nr:leucokinin [Eupeodes corollae]
MISTKLLALFILMFVCYGRTDAAGGETPSYECNLCEEQLAKYRKFILQAIINFEDVCDSYHPDSHDFLHSYQPKERGDIWAFFKLLMAQFNDVDFVNVVHDAVIDRCRTRFQREEKRDPTMLGKKQRFHSWGGKRALQPPSIDLNNRILDEKTSDKPYFI